jgi:hypothetical protein
MENNQLTKEPRKRSNNIKWLLLYFIALIGVASGVYLWQHSNVNNLNKKISQLNKTNNKNNPATLSTESFIYSPQIGGLTLKLPKSYGIVVNIDGNKGGAAGSVFRVGTLASSNILNDATYQGVQVDVDNVSSTLDEAVDIKKYKLENEDGATSSDRHIKVSDSMVAKLPAKLVAADGLSEYQGHLAIYLIKSGDYLYTIQANGTQFGGTKILDAVLNGISIKPVTS